jgi:hypothetical protein
VQQAYSTYVNNTFVGSMLRTLCHNIGQVDTPANLHQTAQLATKCSFYTKIGMKVSAKQPPPCLKILLGKVFNLITGGANHPAAAAAATDADAEATAVAVPCAAVPSATAGADATTAAHAAEAEADDADATAAEVS